MDLERALAQSIALGIGGRIRLLDVRILGSRVVVRGCASSYHVVQIALAKLLESFQELNLDRPEEVELDIDVASHGPGGSAVGAWPAR
jgi:hypothetical protein